MSLESFIALGLTASVFILSEQLIIKYQCRQKSMEEFWKLNRTHIWRNSLTSISNTSFDRCGIPAQVSIGNSYRWEWGKSKLEYSLSPGTIHE